MKLEALSEAQEALMAVVADEYVRDITDAGERIDDGAVERWLTIVYRLYDLPVQKFELADSLEAAIDRANELDPGGKHTEADWSGFYDGGWLSFYDYFDRIGILADLKGDDRKALDAVRALIAFRRFAWDTILFDELAIVIRSPKSISVDDEGRLHAQGGPCIEWHDGKKDFAWHGTWVSEKIACAPRSHTAEEFAVITNTEERRALCEAAGWDWVAEILRATPVDSWTDERTGLAYTLLACADGTLLLQKQSPALKTGGQPVYLEPVHEELKTAAAARKWQATDWTPQQCESDPRLVYGVER